MLLVQLFGSFSGSELIPTIAKWVFALVALLFAAVLLSIYQQERKIPSLLRVWQTMLRSVVFFPEILLHRIAHAPLRARRVVRSVHARLSRVLVKAVAENVPPLSHFQPMHASRMKGFLSKNARNMEGGLACPVSSGKGTVPLAEALLHHPHSSLVRIAPTQIKERFSSGKWKAFDAHEGAFRAWIVSRKVLKPGKMNVKVYRTRKGVFFVA